MKRLGDWATLVAIEMTALAIASAVFWSGFWFGAMHAGYQQSLVDHTRSSQAEFWDANAAYYRRLNRPVPGPEVYTPAPPHPGDPLPEEVAPGEPTPAAVHELPLPTPAKPEPESRLKID